MTKVATSIAEVVATDLCVGCGLCEAVTGGRLKMTMTAAGSLRPTPLIPLSDAMSDNEERVLLAACPGVVAQARDDPDRSPAELDPIWGSYRSMSMAWAAEPDVRFRAATGGVLTALGRHLLDAGKVSFVLHVGPIPDSPTRNRWVISETADDVLANTGSRYSPAAPLAGLMAALDRGQRFAIIAKPCDLGAVHAYAATDPRVDELCVARLAMVCGGQSRLTKTLGLLDRWGLVEDDVSLIRYRGHGNPGPTRVESNDGQAHEVTYLELWEDASTWEIETRCKLCPDALGECADVAAADAWPGGAPIGEDEGFNAIVVRTTAGQSLVDEAVMAGKLVVDEPVTARQLDDFQPHQVRKKEALAARYAGLLEAGVAPINAPELRLQSLGQRLTPAEARREREGAKRRMEAVLRVHDRLPGSRGSADPGPS